MTTPLKVEFSDRDIEILKQLANDRDITATSVVHQAISTELYIHNKSKSGTRFFAIDPDGSQYEVRFR